jgi:flagellar hook-associated protein 1 FlgK
MDGNGQMVVQSTGTTLIEGSTSRTLSVTTATDGTLRILSSWAGGTPSDVSRNLSGGMLAGIRDARDLDARAVLNRLDQLAYDVATAVNAQHAAGFGLDGLSGRNLFSVSGTVVGAARSLAVDSQLAGQPDRIAASSSASGLQGDSTNALLLAQLADARFASGATRTGAQAFSDIVGEIGLRKQSASIDATTRDGMLAQVKAMRESASGVSLDEEMVSLTQYQRAYEAASRVLTTADELLAELIATVGR